jgi:hypothetical protein
LFADYSHPKDADLAATNATSTPSTLTPIASHFDSGKSDPAWKIVSAFLDALNGYATASAGPNNFAALTNSLQAFA